MSYAKRLGKTLGGKWTYDGHTSWWCNDGSRHVSRVCAGVDEWDNPVGRSQYWLYGDGPPRPAEGYMWRPLKFCFPFER